MYRDRLVQGSPRFLNTYVAWQQLLEMCYLICIVGEVFIQLDTTLEQKWKKYLLEMEKT